jgi:glycosyltransferase involved in cell wall biosynthesis
MNVVAILDGHHITGPARQLLATGPALRKLGIEIALAVFQRRAGDKPLVAEARALGFDVSLLSDRFPGSPATLSALAAEARRPDVSVLQTHGYKANVLARLLARRLGKPWIAFLHGETSENAKVRLYFALERRAVRQATRVVVVSHAMARRTIAAGVPAASVRVIHNAALFEAPDLGATPAAAANGIHVVSVAGRLSPEKGVDVALRAHAHVRACRDDVRLAVAGDGQEAARLKRLATELGIESSIDWLGHLADVRPLYRKTTILLLPSRSEGLPNVALEAMAHGVPVVAAAVGGVPELITDEHSGLLVEAEDAPAMAARIVRLLDDASLRERLGEQGRKEVGARFSLEARVRELSSMYQDVVA